MKYLTNNVQRSQGHMKQRKSEKPSQAAEDSGDVIMILSIATQLINSIAPMWIVSTDKYVMVV